MSAASSSVLTVVANIVKSALPLEPHVFVSVSDVSFFSTLARSDQFFVALSSTR